MIKNQKPSLVNIDTIKQILNTNDRSVLIALFKQLYHIYDYSAAEAILKSAYIAIHGKSTHKDLVNTLYLAFQDHGLPSPKSNKCYSYRNTNVISQQENAKHKPLANLKPLDVCSYKLVCVGSIPHILHNVWTTSVLFDDAKKISTFDKHNIYMSNNVQFSQKWEHKFWFLSEDFASTEMLNKARAEGFKVHFITELATTPEKIFLVNSAMVFATISNFIIACDIIKYLVLEEYGGLYIDGDYKLHKSPDELINNFDSIFTDNYTGDEVPFIETHFLAARPHHPIFKDAILKAHRNLQMIDAPLYTKFPCLSTDRIVNLIDSPVLKFASDAEITPLDVIMPKGVLSTKDKSYNPYDLCQFSDMSTKIGILGNDEGLASWWSPTPYDYS